jgi:hypothetical protein
MELLYRVGGLTGDEIGSLSGISASAVSQERKRLVPRMAEGEAVKRLFEEPYRNVRYRFQAYREASPHYATI